MLRVGVFAKATEGFTDFCANLNCVAKPSPTDNDFGKVQAFLNRINHHHVPKTRAAIDFRDLNKLIVEKPIQLMPSLKDLKTKLPKSAFATQLDLRQMYFSVPVSPASRKYFNFWYRGSVYTHKRLPMGCSLSSFVGCQVTNITFSNEHLSTFLQLKQLERNSTAFPYSNIDEFLIVYADDLIVFSDRE